MAPVLRRALLYIPASSPRMLQKSLSLTVDSVAYDLEDSVAMAQKPVARKALSTFLNTQPGSSSIGEVSIRINSVSSGMAEDDLTTVVCVLLSTYGLCADSPKLSSNIDAVVIPKVSTASDLKFVTDVIHHKRPGESIKIIALIESALAIQNLSSICSTPNLSGLIFAAEDFALDLSLTRTPSLKEFLYARSAIVTAGVAAKIPSLIDLVHTGYGTPAAESSLREESLGGKGLGFNGKQIIHPSQIGPVQEAFAPSKEEITWAVRIIAAGEKAEAIGKGAWGLDGKMIDAPVIGKAYSIVERARLCRIDIANIKEKWKGQEPK